MINQRMVSEPLQTVNYASIQHITSPAPREVWTDLARADPHALVFQQPGWTDALCNTGLYRDTSIFYEFQDGRKLLLPMVARKGLPAWLGFESSFPNSWGMGGFLCSDELLPEHIEAVVKDLQLRNRLRITIRPNPLVAQVWAAARLNRVTAIPMRAHVLDLSGGFEQVWSTRFTGEARTAVRKAERAGLTIECDTTGRLIPVFYDLFIKSVDRWAEQQHEPQRLAHWRAARRDPLEKFAVIAKSIGEAFHLWVAWKDNHPAAAILVLQGGNTSYTRGAMDKELAGPTRANQLLHRLAIEDACRAGCRYYHMGESGESTSLAQFKTRFGAVPVDYAEYIIEWLPVTQLDRRLRALIKQIIGFKDMH